MYPIRDDRVVEIASALRPDPGAPLPALVCDERNLLLAYIVSEPDPDWDGTYINLISPDSPGETIAILRFKKVWAHLFGPPNDEAFAGHPLAERGLRPYSVSEVKGSSWIHLMERMNAVHPSHDPARFSALRHFIFAFHDSTFECAAEGYEVKAHRGSMRSAFRLMTQLMEKR